MRKEKTDCKLKGPVHHVDRGTACQGEDVVCPECYLPLKGYSAFGVVADRYGRITRKYFGWCLHCDFGCEVMQFSNAGKWQLHRYQHWVKTKRPGVHVPQGWVDVEPLPEPPLVMVGPGGDYDQAKSDLAFIAQACSVLETAANALRELVKSKRREDSL